MSSEVQARELVNGRRAGRRSVAWRSLRILGVLAVGVALVTSATGVVSAAPAQAGCGAPAAGQPNGKQWPAEPGMTIDTNAGYTATLATNCGAVTIALDASRAPRTVNSFVFLAGEQYFDHTKCHRITTEGIYVLQCGDPTATGMGGPGYQFPDENLAGATYPAGTIAMANAGPGTNGSQFFVVYRDAPLPPSYTPFGRVTAGMDVLTSIAAAGVKDGSSDGEPAAGVVLNSVSAGRN
ncbi:peptidylprolyl isomerase [Nocardia beijingensis]|uniref:peptidylprolyl isomerase n=1 Tax=Nocardia beijingensis TaxID=95162 RepID=UPI000A4057DF|nr:peptidylprolyl isomerase [Nocardia beijingensis]